VYVLDMQTFVPVTDSFESIAKVLDRQRLNKQALEGWQILMTLLELDPRGNHRAPKGWVNHPAVKMWRGHEMALYVYIQAMVNEWKRRGYKSTIGDKAKATITRALQLGLITESSVNPEWMSDYTWYKQIASSHREALLNKNYEWYSQFGWAEDPGHQPESYDYVWPV
jgi:hypothetical protein